jgi:hypothetical protein
VLHLRWLPTLRIFPILNQARNTAQRTRANHGVIFEDVLAVDYVVIASI